jgi:predicted phosphohydrolase
MEKFAWLTDIHLDHLRNDDIRLAFAELVAAQPVSGLIVTGDISNANELVYHLSLFERAVGKPIYFVLGNHDFWGSDIATTRKKAKDLSAISTYLKYLSVTPYQHLSTSTALVGHDGWYDALNGNGESSRFVMVDWRATFDFRNKTQKAICEISRKLAHEATMHVRGGIAAAVKAGYKNIIVATHVPPFWEFHRHEGAPGSAEANPWFTSQLMGNMLRDAASFHSDVNFKVLCGHTHGKCVGQIGENLSVLVGGAEYGNPIVQQVIDIV